MKKILILAACLMLAASLPCLGGKKTTTTTATISFHNGETFVWPFSDKRISASLKTPSFAGEEATFTTRDGLYTIKVKSAGGCVTNSVSGFRSKMASGDYLELPSVPNLSPVKVSIVSGGRFAENAPRIETAEGSPVAGGEALEGKTPAGESAVWELSGVKAGTPLRIVSGAAGISDVRKIEVTYEGVLPKVKKEKPAKVKGKVVTVNFRDDADAASVWPFTEKKPSPSSPVTDVDFTTESLEEFSVKCSDKVYLNSKGGFCFGNGKYDRLTLPSFGTRALVKIEMTAGNKGAMGKPEIKNPNNWATVEGGAAFPSFTPNEVYTWELKNTLPGERYRIVLTATGTLSIKKLVLYYQ